MNIFNKDDNNKTRAKKKRKEEKPCTYTEEKCLRMSDNDPGAREHKTPRNLPQIFCTYKRTTRRRIDTQSRRERADERQVKRPLYLLLLSTYCFGSYLLTHSIVAY